MSSGRFTPEKDWEADSWAVVYSTLVSSLFCGMLAFILDFTWEEQSQKKDEMRSTAKAETMINFYEKVNTYIPLKIP